jgi:hypothetical protein
MWNGLGFAGVQRTDAMDRPWREGPDRAAVAAGRGEALGSSREGLIRWTALGIFVGLIIFGVVLRVVLARSSWMELNSDEATGMLMALRASQGHLSLLFSGLNYGGALLSWIEAPLIAVFGLHLWVFSAVDTVLAVLGSVVLRAAAGRMLKPIPAAVAGGAFCFFPERWLYWSGREYAFWETSIVLAITTGWLVLRWFDRRNRATVFLVGLSAGLSIWCYPLVVAIVAPAVAVLVWAERRNWRVLGLAAAGGAIGIGPYAIALVLLGPRAFAAHNDSQSVATAFHQSIVNALPASFGRDLPVAAVGIAIYAAAVIALIVFVARRQIALGVCAASVVIWPLALIASHSPVVNGTYRYAFVVLPSLLVLAGYVLSILRLSVAGAAAAMVFVVSTASGQTSGFKVVAACGGNVAAIARYIESQGANAAWGSYWVASDITVCDQAQIPVGVVQGKADAESRRAATEATPSIYVVAARQALDGEISQWSTSHQAGGERITIGQYAIWTFPGQTLPSTMNLTGSS